MQAKQTKSGTRTALIACAFLLASILHAQQDAPIAFTTTIDLALRNSNAVLAAQASVEKSVGALTQAHDVYIPNLVGGSNLGYSYGFPLGQPTIFNFGTQSLIFNFAQPDYIRSARASLKASQLSLQDARQQIIEDAAWTYIQLDTALQQQTALDTQFAAADKLAEIATARESSGIDSSIDVDRAELIQAQIHLKQLHGANTIATLRDHLSHLTGLPAATIATLTTSIPATPDAPAGLDSIPQDAAEKSPAVESAFANAQAAMYTAFGDSHRLWRPELDFSAQYSRFASFNNYSEYYKSFQSSNFGIGMQLTLPVFDPERRAHARESAADAVHARREAELLRDQAAEGNLQTLHALQETNAKQNIARLESKIASEQLRAIITQLQSTTGTSQLTPQLSPKDEQNARIDERQKFVDLLGARLDFTHMQLDLLRATGGIEDWALPNQTTTTTPAK